MNEFGAGVSTGGGLPPVQIFENPTARIWIWSKNGPQRDALQYGHVALELHSGGERNVLTYISYWKSSISAEHAATCGQEPHYHHSKVQDDACAGDYVSSHFDLTYLNIAKIRVAFEKFKQDGSLGWAIFHKPYQKNQVGLIAYLLDRGGIYALTTYKRSPFQSHWFKIVALASLIFAILNFKFSLKSDFVVRSPHQMQCGEVNAKLLKIFDLILMVEKQDSKRNIAQEREQLARESYASEPNSPSLMASEVRAKTIYIASEALFAVSIYFGATYLYHRFWQDPVDTRDIEILVRKGAKFEQRDTYRKYHQQSTNG